MKLLITLLGIWVTIGCLAQSPIQKIIPIAGAEKIEMHFDYPNLIRLSSWDKNEVYITGTVSINGGESDDAFKLTATTSAGSLLIKGEVPNIKDLPQRITVIRNGEKMVFKNKREFENYKKEHDTTFDMTSWGHDVEIVLDIKVPVHLPTRIKSVHGTVELKDLHQTAPLIAQSIYGGIDAALNTLIIGELFATTDYGEIYSNLGLKFSGEGLKQRDFHTEIIAKVGNGQKYSFESKYGNVYLRKK